MKLLWPQIGGRHGSLRVEVVVSDLMGFLGLGLSQPVRWNLCDLRSAGFLHASLLGLDTVAGLPFERRLIGEEDRLVTDRLFVVRRNNVFPA